MEAFETRLKGRNCSENASKAAVFVIVHSFLFFVIIDLLKGYKLQDYIFNGPIHKKGAIMSQPQHPNAHLLLTLDPIVKPTYRNEHWSNCSIASLMSLAD